MCGITGFSGPPDTSFLRRMTGTLIHRGPDEAAYYQDQFCSLGMRRLAIIDLTRRLYPLTNEDKSVLCIFNGEIYNFQIVKRKLLRLGHRFATESDAEVIVHGYEEWGITVLAKLNGMFAFCLYDKRRRTLFLARDRLGKKPLYWSVQLGQLIFGSELKALLPHPAVKREIDLLSLSKYFAYEYVPAPATIWKNIFKLEAGHYLVFKDQKAVVKRYWDVTFKTQSAPARNASRSVAGGKLKAQNKISKLDEKSLLAKLDKKLMEAVQDRLVADVPIGVFLSGGIDSSTIAYYASQNSARPLQTFSIGFEEDRFDESQYASQVAKILGTQHHRHVFTAKSALGLVPELYAAIDEPFADYSLLPTFALSKFTRERVTVALGGDGGDELFMGYPTFLAHRLAGFYEHVPKLLRTHLIGRIIALFPAAATEYSWTNLAKKFARSLDYPWPIRNQTLLSEHAHEFALQVLAPDVVKQISGDVYSDIQKLLVHVDREPVWNQLIYLYFKMYLADDILTKVDRASMLASLEVRAPFLDYHLVDFVNALPPHYKLRGVQAKYLLKKLMRGRLPDTIIDRPKKGFGIPLGHWLSKELAPLIHTYLAPQRIRRAGLFDPAYVDKLTTDHLSGRENNSKKIWMLLCFEFWKKQWLDSTVV